MTARSSKLPSESRPGGPGGMLRLLSGRVPLQSALLLGNRPSLTIVFFLSGFRRVRSAGLCRGFGRWVGFELRVGVGVGVGFVITDGSWIQKIFLPNL